MPTTDADDPSIVYRADPCSWRCRAFLDRALAADEAFLWQPRKTVVVVLIAAELCGLRSVIDARANRFLEP